MRKRRSAHLKRVLPHDTSRAPPNSHYSRCLHLPRTLATATHSYPYGYSANTGFYAPDTASIYMIIDAAGKEYMVLTLDSPNSEPGGHLGLDVTSSGLRAGSVDVLMMDDPNEQTKAAREGRLGRLGPWSPANASGSFHWEWGSCCTDGMILGPLPESDFQMTFRVTKHNPELAGFRVRQRPREAAARARVHTRMHCACMRMHAHRMRKI